MSPVVRANWILGLAALLLGAWLWHDLEQDQPAYPPLTDLDPRRIQRIFIESRGELVEHLRREGEEWVSLRGPVRDRQWIERLLHIAELPSLQRFPAPENLAPFGLDAPEYRLRLDDTTLSWGGLEPVSGRRYLLVNGRIHLVTDGYTHHLHPAPEPP